MPRKSFEERIAAKLLAIDATDERIGALTSRRADLEEQLADIYRAQDADLARVARARVPSRTRAFHSGQLVEIRREVGSPWERATYVKRWEEARGWHSVNLPDDAPPRFINVMSGDVVPPEVMADPSNPRAMSATRTRHVGVPSQRIRSVSDRPTLTTIKQDG